MHFCFRISYQNNYENLKSIMFLISKDMKTEN